MTTTFLTWLDKSMSDKGGRRYSQSKLAKDLGISEATVSGWYADKAKQPSDDHLVRVAIWFNEPMEKVFGFFGRPLPDPERMALLQLVALAYVLDDSSRRKAVKELRERYVAK